MREYRSSFWRETIALPALLCTWAVACSDHDAYTTSPPPDTNRGQTVAVAYCAPVAPMWVAFQDGDGAWTRALPEVSGNTTTFRHEFSSDRGAIATLSSTSAGGFTTLDVLYGAPAELTDAGDTLRADCVAEGTKILLGSVAGLNPSDLAQIKVGFAPVVAVSPASGSTFAPEDVPAGPQDLLAARPRNASDGTSSLRFILRRNLNLPNGATIPTLDFTSPEAFDAATPNVTLTSAAASALTVGLLHTKNGQFALPFFSDQPRRATRPYLALPEGQLEPGDVQVLHVSATNQSMLTVDAYYRAPIDRTIQFGAPMIAPTLTVIGTRAAPRIRARFVQQPDYDRLTSVTYQEASSPSTVRVSMTPVYAALVGGYQIDIPDLLAASGFQPAWGLIPGHGVVWTAIRIGGTLPRGRNAMPADGMTRLTSSFQSTLTVP